MNTIYDKVIIDYMMPTCDSREEFSPRLQSSSYSLELPAHMCTFFPGIYRKHWLVFFIRKPNQLYIYDNNNSLPNKVQASRY